MTENFGALPTDIDTAQDVARAAFGAAKDLLADHRKNVARDGRHRPLLRAASELLWLANVSACQMILLRYGRTISGGAKDLTDARQIDSLTDTERDALFYASRAVDELHVTGFYRGDATIGSVRRWIDLTAKALAAAAEEK